MFGVPNVDAALDEFRGKLDELAAIRQELGQVRAVLQAILRELEQK